MRSSNSLKCGGMNEGPLCIASQIVFLTIYMSYTLIGRLLSNRPAARHHQTKAAVKIVVPNVDTDFQIGQ